MNETRDPLDFIIEVCRICGCQLGPGVGSRTVTGRCVELSHWSSGGVVMRVIARHPVEQDAIAARVLRDTASIPRAWEPQETAG